MLIFEEYFKKRGLQLKWKSKSDMKYEPQTARFALTYRPFDIFWEINRGSVSEQGWGSAFEVMQYFLPQYQSSGKNMYVTPYTRLGQVFHEKSKNIYTSTVIMY
ncbi:Hypothetical_protein [Hexamita inflata]|uniref:Hypothetical_protein n=1 Tax=Hexamita inflata TaxID=28002 RepID=A0AA86TPR6_9EUKA|nr:Hypothetical protein HINF_LOCUS9902 [Hexamita inflata]